MSIIFDGHFGQAKQGWFELALMNPSGQVVLRSQMYKYDAYPTGFTDSVTYVAGQTGTWTAELTYNTAGKRFVKTTVEGSAQAVVI